jgi:hypothetical protein
MTQALYAQYNKKKFKKTEREAKKGKNCLKIEL